MSTVAFPAPTALAVKDFDLTRRGSFDDLEIGELAVDLQAEVGHPLDGLLPAGGVGAALELRYEMERGKEAGLGSRPVTRSGPRAKAVFPSAAARPPSLLPPRSK